MLCQFIGYSRSYDGYIDVYTSLDESGSFIKKIVNGSVTVNYEYVVVYSDYLNYNMSLLRNGVFEKYSYSRMTFDVFEFDNITIIANNLRFEFFVEDVAFIPLEDYIFDRQGSIRFFTNIGRTEVIISVFGIGLVVTLLLRYFYLRRR